MRAHVAIMGLLTLCGISPGVASAGMNSSPNWTYDGLATNGYLGNSVSTAGDVNGDGYSDLIVGEPYYDNGQTDEGRALVFHGSATGLESIASWMYQSDSPFTLAGYAVSTAGDVNGDGYDDVIVGIPEWTVASNHGRAVLFLGSPTGLSSTPAWIKDGESANGSTFGLSVSTAGDVNDDGYDDVLIGDPLYGPGTDIYGRAYLYLGSAAGLNTTAIRILQGETNSSRLGIRVATAGDVNGDGRDDILVGADGWDDPFHVDAGRAYCYLGTATGIAIDPVWQLDGDLDSEFLGQALATAGDLDGDGYADILVGREHFDNGLLEIGLTQVFRGSPTGPETDDSWAVLGAQASDFEGTAVFSAGDVNGDGYADLATGARGDENGAESGEGVVRVYLGSENGPLNFGQPMVTLDSDLAGAEFGSALCCAGDVNGDGFSDLAVGAPLADVPNGNQGGRAYVFHGKPDDYANLASFTYEPGQATAYLGSCVRFADVNGDGYSELLAGAFGWDNPDFSEGKAFLWYGGLGGASGAPDWSQEGNQVLASYGQVIDSAGDVNGDGYGDVIVTAPFYDGLATDDGRAYIYLGSIGGLATSAAWTASPGQPFARFGTSAASCGDVNGDGYGDVIIGMPGRTNPQPSEGAAWLFHGSASGLSPVLSNGWEGNQDGAEAGTAVAGAGDVNGDGYDDIISGAPYFDNGQVDEGVVFVFFGAPNGMSNGYSQLLEANQAGARFGSSLSSAGDVNGDGFSDVIVGAPRWTNGDSREGAFFVYLGSAAGLNTAPQRVVEGSGPDRNLGTAVICAGDVDLDGYSDVVVGAPGSGANGEGVVTLYRGGPTGTAGSGSWSRTGDGGTAGGSFGFSLGGCGDLDGDGYNDVAVGDPDWTNPSTYEGRVYVFGGNQHDSNAGGAGRNRALISYRTDFSAPIALRGVSDATDSFRFILQGRTPAGRGDVRFAMQALPHGQPWNVIVERGPWADTGTVLAFDGSATALGGLASDLTPGTRYHYRVRTECDSPYFPRTPWFFPHGNASTEADLRTGFDTSDASESGLTSTQLSFEGVFPNPVVDAARIRFALSEPGAVKLTLHDLLGRRVAVLADGTFAAGAQSIEWNGRGVGGRRLLSGVYFARLEGLGELRHARIVITR
ncbi:MAG: FG-GAP repeat protein [Candidatus Eisenbacteria bacterium]|nr:FG-GAP repeat protein [Candidatus Eisenbacteria bacterium]